MLKKLVGKVTDKKTEGDEDDEDSGPDVEEKSEPHVLTINTAWDQTFKIDTNNLNIKAFDDALRSSLLSVPWPGGSAVPLLQNAKRYSIKLLVGEDVRYNSEIALRNELDMWSYDYGEKLPHGSTATVVFSATNADGRTRRVV